MKKWVTWLLLYLLTGYESAYSPVVSISGKVLAMVYRTNEHIANMVKTLVTY